MAAGSPEGILKGLSDLPRLEQYLPQLAESDGAETVSEERLSLAMDNCVADYQESLEASNVEVVPYYEIFKVSEDEYEEFMEQYNVPEFFLSSLRFAYQLDLLFMKGAVGGGANEIDFSPVTIMYCNEVFNPDKPDTYFDPVK